MRSLNGGNIEGTDVVVVFVVVVFLLLFFIDDRLYSAILRSFEQTHCACMWFCMSD